MDDKMSEKLRRNDMAIGIIVAAALGFILNLYANLFYEFLIVHRIKWSEIDQIPIYLSIFIFIALLGFLQFLIEDYKNNIEVNRNFFKRYSKYFFYQFTPGKYVRIVTGLFITGVLGLFVAGLSAGIFIQITKGVGIFWSVTTIIGILFGLIILRVLEKKGVKENDSNSYSSYQG